MQGEGAGQSKLSAGSIAGRDCCWRQTKPSGCRLQIQRTWKTRSTDWTGHVWSSPDWKRGRHIFGGNVTWVAQATIQQPEYLQVERVSYRATGSSKLLLQDVCLGLPDKSLGLIYGRSGSGKTTLLQVLAGLATPTSGSVFVGAPPSSPAERQPCVRAELAALAGIVFQFPERYFLGGSVLEELTLGWPRRPEDLPTRQILAVRLQAALQAVGLTQLSLEADPRSLSGGNQRRLALATQLVRLPHVLLLDEPLAGLDWRARADVVQLLAEMKNVRAIVVVSHDLRELSPLVDRAWHMEMGGRLRHAPWSPAAAHELAPAFPARTPLH